MNRINLDGILLPITTPFLPDSTVDYEGLRRNIALYNQYPLAGYVVGGSTGESIFLAKDEKLKIWETVKNSSAPGRILIAGAAYESVRETVRMAHSAAARGFDAALLMTPHYYRAQMQRPESQLSYYRAVADASEVPVLIYNFPQVTGLDIPAEVVAQLAAHANIAGIKESSGDLVKVKALMESVPSGFQVVVGAAAKYFASLSLGAAGGILAIGDAIPSATLEIHARFRAGDLAGASAVQDRIAEACTVAPVYGIQGLKYAMDLKGFAGGPVRLPLQPVAEADKPRIAAMFHGIENRAATSASK